MSAREVIWVKDEQCGPLLRHVLSSLVVQFLWIGSNLHVKEWNGIYQEKSRTIRTPNANGIKSLHSTNHPLWGYFEPLYNISVMVSSHWYSNSRVWWRRLGMDLVGIKSSVSTLKLLGLGSDSIVSGWIWWNRSSSPWICAGKLKGIKSGRIFSPWVGKKKVCGCLFSLFPCSLSSDDLNNTFQIFVVMENLWWNINKR